MRDEPKDPMPLEDGLAPVRDEALRCGKECLPGLQWRPYPHLSGVSGCGGDVRVDVEWTAWLPSPHWRVQVYVRNAQVLDAIGGDPAVVVEAARRELQGLRAGLARALRERHEVTR